jgi:hypothetical protein
MSFQYLFFGWEGCPSSGYKLHTGIGKGTKCYLLCPNKQIVDAMMIVHIFGISAFMCLLYRHNAPKQTGIVYVPSSPVLFAVRNNDISK